MTPADATEIVIDTKNPRLGAYHTKRFNTSHAGGKALGEMNASLHNITATGTTITVSMLVDGAVVDRVNLYQHDSGIAGGSSFEWGTEETGRNVENPLSPEMTVLRTSGPIISIAAQTPYNRTGITLDGGGFFSSMAIEETGGSPIAFETFVMNSDMPSGTYSLRMKDGYNGMELVKLDFSWNANTKEVSLVGDNPQIDAISNDEFDDDVSAAQRQADRMAALNGIHVSFTSLREVQRIHFFEASKFMMDDAQKEEIELRFPIEGHPDRNAIFHQGLDAWQNAIGELLQYGVEAIVDAWNGESQAEGHERFNREWDRIWPLRYLREFEADFGVSLPSKDQIFDEAKRIATEKLDALHDHQSKNEQMIKRDVYLANLKQEEQRPLLGMDEESISIAAFEHNLRVIADVHGTDSEVYINYLAKNGVPYVGGVDVAVSGNDAKTANHHLAPLGGDSGSNGDSASLNTADQSSDSSEVDLSDYETIADRVAARLGERLESMTIEERAIARGLIRLSEYGILDEYLEDLFSSDTSDTSSTPNENVALSEATIPNEMSEQVGLFSLREALNEWGQRLHDGFGIAIAQYDQRIQELNAMLESEQYASNIDQAAIHAELLANQTIQNALVDTQALRIWPLSRVDDQLNEARNQIDNVIESLRQQSELPQTTQFESDSIQVQIGILTLFREINRFVDGAMIPTTPEEVAIDFAIGKVVPPLVAEGFQSMAEASIALKPFIGEALSDQLLWITLAARHDSEGLVDAVKSFWDYYTEE